MKLGKVQREFLRMMSLEGQGKWPSRSGETWGSYSAWVRIMESLEKLGLVALKRKPRIVGGMQIIETRLTPSGEEAARELWTPLEKLIRSKDPM